MRIFQRRSCARCLELQRELDRTRLLLRAAIRVGEQNADQAARWHARSVQLAESAREVMRLLDERGSRVVPHLVDSDQNPGQRLRDLADETLGRARVPQEESSDGDE